jgi:hypothetical protein
VVELMVMVWSAGILDAPACTVKASEGGLTVICGVPADPLIVIEKLAVAEFPQASLAVKLKLDVPFETGVPVMERVKSALV